MSTALLDLEQQQAQQALRQQYEFMLAHWVEHPVDYVCQVFGAQPDPWQCDVMDALADPLVENVGLRACHGVGKTALEAWIIPWFTTTRPESKVPSTAPTYQKQVRDILWAEIHKWWSNAERNAPWLTSEFKLISTELQHRTMKNWFAVGIPSSQPINIEGYHATHLLAVFDEAKSIKKAVWDAIHGMRTTQEAKLFCASTPGGPSGEFYKVFTQYRTTWKNLFIIHPEALRAILKRKEAPHYSTSGTYYSTRVRAEWVQERRDEWGPDSPVFIARVIGDFPQVAGDVLIPYGWIVEAEEREAAIAGAAVVSCDVARFGRDRTVILAGEGGKLQYGETIARTAEETTAEEIHTVGVGDDPRHPRYRAIDITADACQRVRRQLSPDAWIVVDDTGLGGGVSDLLRRRGEKVVAINFGAAPTDRPKDAEERASKRRRHLLDSKFVNLKAQMGWALRNGFEAEAISLADLPKALLDALVAQLSMVKTDMDSAGRLKIVDPDEQDEYAVAAGQIEGRKSPDHFHSLLLYWWVASGASKDAPPIAGAVTPPTGIKRFGHRLPGPVNGTPHMPRPSGGAVVGGQARHVIDRYRRR